MVPSPRLPELGALTSSRFLAALVVVFSHYAMIVPVAGPLVPALTQGQAAVSFFFVLSGFILAYNYHDAFRDGVRRQAFGSYYRARFARIFPLHAVALLALTPLVVLAMPVGTLGWLGWLVDLCMLQGVLPFTEAVYGWNTPAWSISCEMAFYLALPFLVRGLWSRVQGDGAALAWLGGLWLVGMAFGLDVVLGLRHLLASWPDPSMTAVVDVAFKFTPFTRGWQFAVGCVAGLWHVRAVRDPAAYPLYHRLFGRPGWAVGLGAAGAAALCYVPFLGGFKGYLLWLLALYPLFTPFFALVVLALAGGSSWPQRLLDRPGPRFLGEASYALYITHLLPYYLLKHDFVPGWRAHPYAWAILGISCSVVASSLLFRHVETPARRWLRDLAWPAPAARMAAE